MSEESRLSKVAETALVNGLRRANPRAAFQPDRSAYVSRAEDNLVAGISLDGIQNDFDQGAGNELKPQGNEPPKFCAAFSSSALAVNAFAPFKVSPGDLNIGNLAGLTSLRFEAPCRTGLGGTPPHLDVLCENQSLVLGIESKCTEFLKEKAAGFRDSYDTLLDSTFEPSWRAVYGELKSDPLRYSPLDAAQLVKHYLGLRHTYPDHAKTLLYVFWEPRNAGDYRHFARHRDAIERFAEKVRQSDVSSFSMSYPELWESWAALDHPPWLGGHVERLRARYLVAVEGSS